MATLRPLDSVRVLIVEDHDDSRDMYVITLEYAGAMVKAARDADAGFQLALDWQPDAIVTDFLLSGSRNGADLCQRIHSDPRTAHIPMLVMTASTRKQDAEELLGAGCAEIRLKPYPPEAMVEDIHRVTASASSIRRTA